MKTLPTHRPMLNAFAFTLFCISFTSSTVIGQNTNDLHEGKTIGKIPSSFDEAEDSANNDLKSQPATDDNFDEVSESDFNVFTDTDLMKRFTGRITNSRQLFKDEARKRQRGKFNKDLGKRQRGFNKDLGKRQRPGFNKDLGKRQRGFNKDLGKRQRGFNKDLGKRQRGFNKDLGKRFSNNGDDGLFTDTRNWDENSVIDSELMESLQQRYLNEVEDGKIISELPDNDEGSSLEKKSARKVPMINKDLGK